MTCLRFSQWLELLQAGGRIDRHLHFRPKPSGQKAFKMRVTALVTFLLDLVKQLPAASVAFFPAAVVTLLLNRFCCVFGANSVPLKA